MELMSTRNIRNMFGRWWLRKVNCNTTGCRQGMHDETSNEVRSMLIEVGWKKSSHSPSSVLRGSWRGPLLEDEEVRSRTRSTGSRPNLGQTHQCINETMIKQVESPQVQHSASRISSGRGRDVAQQPQRSILQISYTFLDMVARQVHRTVRLRRVVGIVRRQEQLGVGQLGEHKDLPQGLDGDIREQRPHPALDVLGAACTSTGDDKNRLHQTCRPVNQLESVCVEKCPLTMRHTAKGSGDSCGESQRLSFGGSAPRRPEAGVAEHDHSHAQAVCQSKRTT